MADQNEENRPPAYSPQTDRQALAAFIAQLLSAGGLAHDAEFVDFCDRCRRDGFTPYETARDWAQSKLNNDSED